MDNELYEQLLKDAFSIAEKAAKAYINNMKNIDIQKALDNYVQKIKDDVKQHIDNFSKEEYENFFNTNYNNASRYYAMTKYGKSSISMLESKRPNIAEDAEEVANELKKTFHLEDFQVIADDSVGIGIPNVLMLSGPSDWMTLSIVVSDFENNEETIDNFMENKGYTMIRKCRMAANTDNGYFVIIYTPIIRIDISKELVNSPYLYHVSSYTNITSIVQQKEITPHSRYGEEQDGGIIYPERIYFFVKQKDALNLREELELTHNEKYGIIRVSTEDIADMMNIYYDPLYGKNAVYVEQPIPSNIIKIKK